MEAVDRIAFRFTEDEAAALLILMNISNLQGMDIAARKPGTAVVSSLIESGIVMPCGEKTLVERIVALVFMTAAKSTLYLRARSGKGRVALYAGGSICVMAEYMQGGIVRMEPFENPGSAEASWHRATAALGEKTEMSLVKEGAELASASVPDEFGGLFAQFAGI